MTDALARLLEGVIDYAGLFPPAKLGMAEAVANYLKYREGSSAWIMDRFVCGSARLGELADELKGHQIETPIPVSVIGQAAADRDAWGDALVHDAQSMTRFFEEVGDKADLEAFEIRLPDHKNLNEYLRDLKSFNQVEVYAELPWAPEMADSLGIIAEQEWMGAKARTGGLEASAFPSTEDVAGFLQQCSQMEVEFKLTAGLHHPFRQYDDSVKTKMHGFLNVLGAFALLQAHDLSRGEVAEILECEDPKAFRLSGQNLAYKDLNAGLEDIEDARDLFVGFGSCSIEEPLQDLRKIGL